MHPGPRNGLVRTRPEARHSLGRPARLRCQQQYLSLCEHACLQPSSWRNVSRAMTHSEATGHDSTSTSTRAPRATRSVDSTHKRRFFSLASALSRARTPSPEKKKPPGCVPSYAREAYLRIVSRLRRRYTTIPRCRRLSCSSLAVAHR
jgi:hypothetical protein